MTTRNRRAQSMRQRAADARMHETEAGGTRRKIGDARWRMTGRAVRKLGRHGA